MQDKDSAGVVAAFPLTAVPETEPTEFVVISASSRTSSEFPVVEKGTVLITTVLITRDVTFCTHPRYCCKSVEGFEIISTKGTGTLEIQWYNECFDISVDALKGSWAGWFLLFRSGYWAQLLTPANRIVKSFGLEGTSSEYWIKGSCHSMKVSQQQLLECWDGGILLAEHSGGWRVFVRHVRAWIARVWWMAVGRHRSRMDQEPRNGIMDD